MYRLLRLPPCLTRATFKPVRLAVGEDAHDDQHREDQHEELEGVEVQRHRLIEEPPARAHSKRSKTGALPCRNGRENWLYIAIDATA